MTEYIDKQAFIEDIETEIINLKLDGMKGTLRPCDELYWFIERIKEQPVADVVGVVRCKDCDWAEFYETSESEDIYECNFWNGEHYGEHARVGGNDYCSYGSMR